MPELPEVETVARQLHQAIAGRKLHSIEVFDPKLSRIRSQKRDAATIVKIYRAGKEVCIECRKDGRRYFLLVHLRMTGRLVWSSKRGKRFDSEQMLVDAGDLEPNQKHLRVRMHLSGGSLDFFDPRRFGTIQNVEAVHAKGIDPISDEFSEGVLQRLVASSKQPIKVWLLRQDRLVGIGNIYASEILFRAQIHPKRAANSLTALECARLARATREILLRAIECCGTTFSDYRDSRNSSGSFQRFLKVYDREGEKCRRCKRALVERIVQAQRSTFYCRECQR